MVDFGRDGDLLGWSQNTLGELEGHFEFHLHLEGSFLSWILRRTFDRYATLDDRFELRHVEQSIVVVLQLYIQTAGIRLW